MKNRIITTILLLIIVGALTLVFWFIVEATRSVIV